jgi:hypothetical protein
MAASDPKTVFPDRNEAICLVLGLAGFWGGFALLCLFTIIGGSSGSPLALISLSITISLTIVGFILFFKGVRQVELFRTGKPSAAWPRGPSLWAQMEAGSPKMLAIAGRRLGLPGSIVAALVYALLLA